MMRRERRRHGRKGRTPTPVFIRHQPPAEIFTPSPGSEKSPIIIEPAELEALRLVDVEGLTQEDAGKRMGISRGTVWRLLQEGRKKTTQALTEGRRMQISSDQM